MFKYFLFANEGFIQRMLIRPPGLRSQCGLSDLHTRFWKNHDFCRANMETQSSALEANNVHQLPQKVAIVDRKFDNIESLLDSHSSKGKAWLRDRSWPFYLKW